MTDLIPIVCASDDGYAPFMSVMMRSVAMHTQSPVEFIVLDGGISNESKTKVHCDLKDFVSTKIRYVDVGKCNLERFAIPKASLNTFSRYFIPELIKEYDRVLYLDCDIVLRGDIKELYNHDLNGHPIGAACDFADLATIPRIRKIAAEYSAERYFNAGVMLIDLTALRKIDFTNKVTELTLKLEDKLFLADQDVLNIFFNGDFAQLDNRFNHISGALSDKSERLAESALVIHYAGHKPWKGRCVKAKLFYEALRKSAFFDDVRNRYFPEKHEKRVTLFGFLPILHVTEYFKKFAPEYILECRLFGVIPIYRIKAHGLKRVHKVFGLKLFSTIEAEPVVLDEQE